MHIYKQSPINTVHTTIILSLKCVRTMSDDQEQLMQQLQQKQQIIKELRQELALQKKKTSVYQKEIGRPLNNHGELQSNTNPKFYSRFLTCLRPFFSEQPKPSFKEQPQKITCPQGHYAYRIYLTYNFCNKCQNSCQGGRVCSKCSYLLCSVCQPVKHNDLCSKQSWKPYHSDQDCIICRDWVTGGKKCQNCSFTICRKCEPVSHETFCSNVKACQYTYHSEDKTCLKCGQYKTGGKMCLKSNINICKSCE